MNTIYFLSDSSQDEIEILKNVLDDSQFSIVSKKSLSKSAFDSVFIVEFVISATIGGLLYDIIKESILSIIKKHKKLKNKREIEIIVRQKEISMVVGGSSVIYIRTKKSEIRVTNIEKGIEILKKHGETDD